MTPPDTPERGDMDPGIDVEHEPTISYLPPEQLEPPGEGRIHGAFGYALVVEKGPRAGMAFILAPGTTQVGRSADNDIFFDDVTVSRHHCTFDLSSRLVVTDLGSTNGTYVNGETVETSTLKPGDEVIIGKYHLMVVRGDG